MSASYRDLFEPPPPPRPAPVVPILPLAIPVPAPDAASPKTDNISFRGRTAGLVTGLAPLAVYILLAIYVVNKLDGADCAFAFIALTVFAIWFMVCCYKLVAFRVSDDKKGI